MAKLEFPDELLRSDGAPLYLLGVEAPKGREVEAVEAASRHGLALVRVAGAARPRSLRAAAHEAGLRELRLLVRLPAEPSDAEGTVQALAGQSAVWWEVPPGASFDAQTIRRWGHSPKSHGHFVIGGEGMDLSAWRDDPERAPAPSGRGRWALWTPDEAPPIPVAAPTAGSQPGVPAGDPDTVVGHAWRAFFHRLHACVPWPGSVGGWEGLRAMADLIGSTGWWDLAPCPERVLEGAALCLASATELVIWIIQGREATLNLADWPGGLPATWLEPLEGERRSGQLLSDACTHLVAPAEPGALGAIVHLGTPRPRARRRR